MRRLISKFRKPSDAGTIGLAGSAASSNTLQVPAVTHGGPASVPTISGLLGDSGSGTSGAASGGGSQAGTGESVAGSTGMASIQRSLAGKQSRWSQLVASAAAGAASKPGVAPGVASSTKGGPAAGSSSGRSLLDIQRSDGGESSSNRSSADGRDDEVDENYFRPGGKGHQALLDNMDKR